MKRLLLSVAILTLVLCYASAQSVLKDTLELERTVLTSVAQSLSGRVSGVLIMDRDAALNSSQSTLVRGVNTIHGDGEPLWIIDGVILSSLNGEQIDMFWQDEYKGKSSLDRLSPLDFVNLHDIESIQVLKNTSATAVYGSLGANGVIIITTKSGKGKDRFFDLKTSAGSSFPGFATSNTISMSADNGRTSYRLSGFYRQFGLRSDKERNAFGGAAFTIDTHAGDKVVLGFNSRVALGSQSSALSCDDQAQSVRTVNNFNISYNIIPSLVWRTDLGLDFQSNDRSAWYDKNTGFGAEYGNVAGLSRASRMFASAKTELSYSTIQLNANHHFHASAGLTARMSDTKTNTMNGTNILVEELKAKGFSYRESSDDIALYRYRQAQYGIFARAGYDFRGWTGLELTACTDVMPVFDKSWKFYPSASVFVDFKKMLLARSKTVSSLRVDGGYGQSGMNRYVPYYMMGYYTDLPVPYYAKDAEPFVRGWQVGRCSEWNIALQLGFLQDRMNLSLNYYDRKTSDMLALFCNGQQEQAGGLWKYATKQEVFNTCGDIVNRGIEVDIDVDVLRNRNVVWNINGNYTYNANNLSQLGKLMFYGVGTTATFYGITARLHIDGYDRSVFAHADASVSYDIPLKSRKAVKSLSVFASTRFLKDYAGMVMPLQSSRALLGIDLKW